MSVVVPGDPSYSTLLTAYQHQRGRVVLVDEVAYRVIEDGGDFHFAPITATHERSSFGTRSKKLRGWYGPDNVQDDEGRAT